MSRSWLTAVLVIVFACATAPPAAPPLGQSTVWGYVMPVPPDGVPSSGGGAYGDRRLRHARLVDYSRPGYAVVYVESSDVEVAEVRVKIRDAATGARFEPAYATAPIGGRTRIENNSAVAHVLSVPAAKRVQRLEPGESIEIRHDRAGPYESFLLDAPGSTNTVFAAPGRFVVVSESGRYELGPLSPGEHVLHTWHPRFPPTSETIVLTADRVTRVDIEIGVGRREGGAKHAR